MKYLTEEILKLHTKELNFFNDRTYYILTEIDRINLNILEEVNKVVIFYPCLITKQDTDDLQKKLFSENNIFTKVKKKTIYILCLFASSTSVDVILKLIKENEITAKITTLYYSDELIKHANTLKNGVKSDMNVKDSEDFLLCCENYCDYFKSMVRRYFN